MKNVKLLSINLENFKGIKQFSLVTNGESVRVFGDNATGKTTLLDGFLWLLFDKDSQNKKDFSIKALETTGDEVHNLNHIVEATFNIDGTEVLLKKVYFEEWVQKRGSSSKEFSGHKTKYYIDEVPKKKKEYTDYVAELVEEELFKLITSPTFFNEQIKWQDRRKLLLEISGDISDDEVFASDNQLAGLNLILKGRSLDDHRKVIAERRKLINEDLKTIPIRINEINKSIPVDVVDIESLKNDSKDIEKQMDENKTLIHNIQNGQALQSKQLELGKVQNDLETVKRTFESDSKEKLYQLQTKLQEEQSNLKINDMKISEQNQGISYANGNLKRINEDLVKLRDEWKHINAKQFEHVEECVCPTCEQDLPVDQVDAARQKALESFNAKKSTMLAEIDTKGKGIAQNKNKSLEDINSNIANLEKFNTIRSEKVKQIEKVAAEIATLKGTLKDVSESPEYIKFMNLGQALEQEIASIKNQSEQATVDIKNANIQLASKKHLIDAEIAEYANIGNLKARIQEYEEQEEMLAKEYQKLEHQVFLTEEFVRRKVELLTEKINAKFKLARFKLFENQINGGLNEVCETTYNGVDYGSLNNAMRVNVGLDIIETLSNHYGIVAPIFVDNAEAVTKLNAIDAQIISLVVSEQDKTLRVESKGDDNLTILNMEVI
ncbi:AAA domain-containing protein [Psychrobacillus insolitus]|uniref:Nuclease SbcCD subunit C n=1 Tax=Psychrobacillus insolitus TaxID=1461 RepID=A0A2W7MN21_9BACI|nr:AAA family ATPase [Psychrobacillus insolitus]PZX07938.1 AAA domain-containing protein [Psychrobacillus insolitus]